MSLLSLFGLESKVEVGSLEWERLKAEEIKKADLSNCIKILKSLGDNARLVNVAVERIKSLTTSFADYERVLRDLPLCRPLAEKMAERMLASVYDCGQLDTFLSVCPDDLPIKERAFERLINSANSLEDWLKLSDRVCRLSPNSDVRQRVESGLEGGALSDDDWCKISGAQISPALKNKALKMVMTGTGDLNRLVAIFGRADNGSESEELILAKIESLVLPRSQWFTAYDDDEFPRYLLTDKIIFKKVLDLSQTADDIIELRDRALSRDDHEELAQLAGEKLLTFTDQMSDLVGLYVTFSSGSDLEKQTLERLKKITATLDDWCNLYEDGDSNGDHWDDLEALARDQILAIVSKHEDLIRAYYLFKDRDDDDSVGTVLERLSSLELSKEVWEGIRSDNNESKGVDLCDLVLRKLLHCCVKTSERLGLYIDYVDGEGSEGDDLAVMMAEQIVLLATPEEIAIMSCFQGYDDIGDAIENRPKDLK